MGRKKKEVKGDEKQAEKESNDDKLEDKQAEKIEDKQAEKNIKKRDKKSDEKKIKKRDKKSAETIDDILDRHGTLSNSKKFNSDFPFLKIDKNQKMNFQNLIFDQKIKLNFYVADAFFSCFDFDDLFIYVGTKRNGEPFNIFEIKEGEGHIIILDKNLNFVNKIEFQFGDILQIKLDGEFIYILFSNGMILKESIENIKKLKIESEPVLADVVNKVINFDVKEGDVVFTNGCSIYLNEKSIQSNMTIIQVLFYGKNILFLDVQGKIHQTDLELKNKTEIFSNYTFNRMEAFNSCALVYSDNDYAVLKINNEIDEEKEKFLGFYKLVNRKIIYFKRFGGRRREKTVFEISENINGIELNCCDYAQNVPDERSGQEKKDGNLFIPRIADCGDFILFCTESGKFFKIFFA
jgi:hypothetical protein